MVVDGVVVVSIRFAPPLVISDEELEMVMQQIEQCLVDFDKVCGSDVWICLV